MKILKKHIVITIFSLIYIQGVNAQETHKQVKTESSTYNQVELKKQIKAEKLNTEQKKINLKVSTTSDSNKESIAAKNKAVEEKINYLKQQKCCEEEIKKLEFQLK